MSVGHFVRNSSLACTLPQLCWLFPSDGRSGNYALMSSTGATVVRCTTMRQVGGKLSEAGFWEVAARTTS